MRPHLRPLGRVVLLLGSFALTVYAAGKLLPRDPQRVTLWFVGAVVAHDLLLLPVYSLLDRPLRAFAERRSGADTAVPWINHVRVPAVLSGLLLLVWFPLILGFPPGFTGITATSTDPYLDRWLGITAALLVGSAIAYGARLLVARRR